MTSTLRKVSHAAMYCLLSLSAFGIVFCALDIRKGSYHGVAEMVLLLLIIIFIYYLALLVVSKTRCKAPFYDGSIAGGTFIAPFVIFIFLL